MASSAFISLEELERSVLVPSYGPGASASVPPPPGMIGRQEKLPPFYRDMSDDETSRRIEGARGELGSRLVILGHHYQRDEIVRHADFLGDSYKLSRAAIERTEAEFIVFCGVHFMAETADILSGEQQRVILPNLSAGCSMADMANVADVSEAWNALTTALGPSLVPVTYMNSSVDLKAFCGEHGGIVCTSSNAAAALEWAFGQGKRLLFFPDEHLGRNTADKLGLDQSLVSVWDPRAPETSLAAADRSLLIVWKGFCSVHERFTADQIRQARAVHPGCRVIVHPECRREVVQEADAEGSTEVIVDWIRNSPTGATIAVGTEINLVNRLAREYNDKQIFCLDPVVCPCSTMYRIHPAYLAWVLDGLLEGRVRNQIVVPASVAEMARIALDRMLTLPSGRRMDPAGNSLSAAVS